MTVKHFKCPPSPGANIDVHQGGAELYLETDGFGKRLSGLDCPFQRAGIDGLDGQSLQRFRQRSSLLLSMLIQMNTGLVAR